MRKILTIALLHLFVQGIFAQKSVGIGNQITSESDIVEGVGYVLQSQAENPPCIADKGTYYGIPDNNPAKEDCVYQFISNGNGTWKIKSTYTGKYWGVPTYNQAIQPVDEAAAGAWTLNFSSGVAYPTAPDANGETRGLDRTSGKLWGFTMGTGGTKQVKIFQAIPPLSDEILEELKEQAISVAANPADNLTTGQWYVMFNRGVNGTYAHGYLYEKVSEHALYNTGTMPEGITETSARFLVRLSDAGEGKYYVQTGYGNYFGAFSASATVGVTATPTEPITIAKIANTNGHFYLQSSSTGVILDANDLRYGDATVVGWGTDAPTTTGGNNDWAFYPTSIVDIDPSMALSQSSVAVTRGYQTCGRGNENSLMLRIDLTPILNLDDANITVSLNAAAQANISSLCVYETTATEFIANIPSSPLGSTSEIGSTATVNIGSVSANSHHFWLCATVKDDAELGAILEATLTGINFTCKNQTHTLNVPASTTPSSRQGMKVFDQQNFVFRPTSDNCRFYRIPAMILDKNNNIVVAADKRYDSNSDLGDHKIDVAVKRSTDGGRTWTAPVTVAEGDYTEAGYGYGDPALVRTQSGKLICLMAAGSKGFGSGQNHIGMVTSTDNGVTWSSVVDITTRSGKWTNNSGMTDFFVTSGKGLCTNDGVLMFLIDADRSLEKNYLLYSTDEGESWTIDGNLVYNWANEAKLEQLNDGSLLASVRPNGQTGNRGWNKATYTKNADGTVTFNWGEQYHNSDIWGNSCNADILYYERKTKDGKDIIIHSYINSSGRQSLQLSMSIDGGNSWKDVYNIQPNGSCYSTMVKLPDGSLAILYEDESYSAGNGYAINYITITKEQIYQWYKNLGGENLKIELLDDDRAEDYSNASRINDNLDITVVDVVLSGRTLYKDNAWNTLCLPFDVNSFDNTPLADAEVRSLESASFSNGTLTLNFSDGLDAMEAGKPYIVRWASGDDISNPVFSEVQLNDATPEVNFDNIGMVFKGVYTPFAFAAQDKTKLYMGNDNKLYYPKKAMTIKAFRAFFDLGDNLVAAEPSATAGAKEITNFVLNFGGETTGVSSFERETRKMKHYYSIDGRRWQGEPTTKGVYIHQGKKVIK